MVTLTDVFRRYGPAYLAKYASRMPQAHHRMVRVIRPVIDIQDFLHRTHKFGARLRNQPAFHPPGLECVFLATGAHSRG